MYRSQNSTQMEPQELELSPASTFSNRWWSKETVAIVTGANKGIGYALVKRLSELGVTVVLTARDPIKGTAAADSLRSLGLPVLFSCLDISDPLSIHSFVSWFRRRFTALDILVNNAAVSFHEVDSHENSVEHADTVIKTNFHGPKLLTESLLPLFRRSGAGSNGGYTSRILNVSSRLGSISKLRNPSFKNMLQSEDLSEEQIKGMVDVFLADVSTGKWKTGGWPAVWTDYAVSKLALNAYSTILARRYGEEGISVNCFCPGFTQTSMTGGKGPQTPDQVADIGASLVLCPPEYLPTAKFFKVPSSRPVTNSKL